jgi:AraC family transcriptional regulator, regulatory protein of adaptative response / DNA-3-methyladenine glycosylase II
MDFSETTLDDTAAYQAIASRDARFDGRLFVGVTSTGIYCRPICRVRVPLRKNCRFFATPAQAEAATFRPCMKCRPEIAPGARLPWTVMDASRTLARQAADALDALSAHGGSTGMDVATGESPSLAQIAARLGVSDRHLRRIFQAEHGVTPLQYVQTRRLLLAKQLLTDTRLPVAQVALASGFNSLRRFNAAFVESYRMSPSRLRGEVDEAVFDSDAAVVVKLGYRPPYDSAALLKFLSLRAIPDIEVIDGLRVRRTLRAGTVAAQAGWVEAEFVANAPVVKLRLAPELANVSGRVVAAVRRWLDLDAMPQVIDAALIQLPGEPGLRLPGSLDAFELACRAVLGQQVTVAAARTLARRLVERFGEPMETPWPDVNRCFPSPEVMAAQPVERIAELGIIRTRAAAMQAIAAAWSEIEPLVAVRARAEPSIEPLVERLCALPGIGPWTAHYIAMRALGWPDAFPPNDVAVLKAMRQLFDTHHQREADVRAQAWQPWRSYAVLRLWNSLQASPSPTPTKASP